MILTWKTFLKEIDGAKQVTLVGPLFNKQHRPTGPTIYVDGGANFRPEDNSITHPMISIGDGDSTDKPLEEVLEQNKDYSDLAYALRQMPGNVRHIDLLGFLGGRRDHELLNFGEVHHYLKGATKFKSARFDDLVVAFCGGKLSMEIHGRFSLIVFDPTLLSVSGACTFPVEQAAQIPNVSSLGLSNMGFGQVFVDSLGPCFLFLDDERK